MNAIIPLVMLLVSRSFDSSDPTNQKYILAVFAVAHVIIVATVFFIYLRVRASKATGTVPVPIVAYPPQKEKQYETLTVQEYDSRKLRELVIQKIIMPVGIMMFIYSKWEVILPLVFSCVNNPLAVYRSELFQIYILGKPAKMELARPWTDPVTAPGWLQKLTGQAPEEPETDKKKKKK